MLLIVNNYFLEFCIFLFTLFPLLLLRLNKIIIFIQKVQQHEAVVCRRAVFDRCELEPLGRWDESSWKAASLRVDVLGILFGDTSGQGEHKDGTRRILYLAAALGCTY